MNAPAHLDSTPRLEDFPYRIADNVRFADLDPNQHVNRCLCDLFRNRPRHADEGPLTWPDAGREWTVEFEQQPPVSTDPRLTDGELMTRG